jgi:hypothetical protein
MHGTWDCFSRLLSLCSTEAVGLGCASKGTISLECHSGVYRNPGQASCTPTCSPTCRGDPMGGIMAAPPARAGSVAPPPPVEGTLGLREGEVPTHTCAGRAVASTFLWEWAGPQQQLEHTASHRVLGVLRSMSHRCGQHNTQSRQAAQEENLAEPGCMIVCPVRNVLAIRTANPNHAGRVAAP